MLECYSRQIIKKGITTLIVVAIHAVFDCVRPRAPIGAVRLTMDLIYSPMIFTRAEARRDALEPSASRPKRAL